MACWGHCQKGASSCRGNFLLAAFASFLRHLQKSFGREPGEDAPRVLFRRKADDVQMGSVGR